jgi:hypothetical protein
MVYGDVSADDLLTWFEIHRRMGVTKVLTYTYDLNDDAAKVLRYYQSQGMVETFPFRLPKACTYNRFVFILKGNVPCIGLPVFARIIVFFGI